MHRLKLDVERVPGRLMAPPFGAAPDSQIERELVAVEGGRGAGTEGRGFDDRRVTDILVSLCLIVLLAPVLVLIALVIVVTNPGPPVFAHRRVGRGGRTFACLKFRSMFNDAECRLEQVLATDQALREEWLREYKLAHDPRVTRVGHILRLSSLDELPQLLNVLMGSMTLVGPRPVTPGELKHYGRFVSHYVSVKPGLTGLWQVTGRSSVSYRRRVATDVLYVRSRSGALDLKILIATIPAVLLGKGAC